MALITTADAKLYLSITDTSEDTIIAGLILSAGAGLSWHCNRRLEAVTVTEYLDGNGQRKLYLPEPASCKPRMYVDANHEWGAASEVGASDMLWSPNRDGTSKVVERLDAVWNEGNSNIKAVFVSGYSTAGMPELLKQAVRVQVARLYSEWKRATKRMDIVASQNVAGWAQQFLDKHGLDSMAAQLAQEFHHDGF